MVLVQDTIFIPLLKKGIVNPNYFQPLPISMGLILFFIAQILNNVAAILRIWANNQTGSPKSAFKNEKNLAKIGGPIFSYWYCTRFAV
ncbi:hypothetical protein GGTG_11247 [Gaeumannomyces tritici R3-111a-1]|uniref:Uncharacterized protein n=1 Tax=Gaeumannomyces tritici (strain R3-111a-1) TaxID=644352 RepID=J3PCM7_GAET3|nr:hypothetical protein GGTG_11247 [Gaeumannomyces tritici R3-111a-1]EJT71997.1 hypothetical protein GGTG_11247 [Gaeumannomyces tritici R3-111a-1]